MKFLTSTKEWLSRAWDGTCRVVRRGGEAIRPVCEWTVERLRPVAAKLGPKIRPAREGACDALRRFRDWIGPASLNGCQWTLRKCGDGCLWVLDRVREWFSGKPKLRRRDRTLLVREGIDLETVAPVPSRTKVDVGYWCVNGRVWLCLLPGELLLFASGKRPCVERVPLEALRESRYNHVTGALVLAPAGGVKHPSLRLPPLEGYEMLAKLRKDFQTDSWGISITPPVGLQKEKTYA